MAAATAFGCGDDPGGRTASTDSSSSSTSATAASQVAEPYPGIWPFRSQAEADAYVRSQDQAYRDPVRTAVGFMHDYGGMEKPVAGEFREGDSRSGEVEVRPKANSPFVTTVAVRRTSPEADVWVVVAAAARNIRLASPVALDLIRSPVLVSGTSSSFEGNVVVQIKEDGMGPGQFLGQEPLIGGSGKELEPFQGPVAFKTPAKSAGAVVALTHSAEDGSVEQLSAARVRFERAAT